MTIMAAPRQLPLPRPCKLPSCTLRGSVTLHLAALGSLTYDLRMSQMGGSTLFLRIEAAAARLRLGNAVSRALGRTRGRGDGGGKVVSRLVARRRKDWVHHVGQHELLETRCIVQTGRRAPRVRQGERNQQTSRRASPGPNGGCDESIGPCSSGSPRPTLNRSRPLRHSARQANM